MSLYVYRPAKERRGEVRSIPSLQWQEAYRDQQSEVKLVCGATAGNRGQLQNGNLLYNTDRPGLIALIVCVDVDDNAKTARMTVRAKMTTYRLEDRVVYYTESYTAAGQGMLDIVSHNLRGLPLLVGDPPEEDPPLTGQISWGSVLDAVDSIASDAGMGYRVAVDPADMSESFEAYRGLDRTASGSEHYVGFFGDAAGNLASIKLTDDVSSSKNVAIVCGQGEGAARRMVEVDLSGDGDRRELYVDARDLAQTVTENGTERTLTDAEYDALLRARGIARLAEAAGGFAVKAQLAQTMLLFGKDYELGDILPLRVAKYGISIKVRVAKIRIVYEQTKKIEATLEVVS